MMDVVLKSERGVLNALEIDGTNYFRSARVAPGGSGNIAAALSHLGGKAAFIGKAGQDPFGTAYLRDLESLRIAARVEFDESASTGFVISLVEPEGHRTMLVSRGANDNLGQQEVKSNLQKLGPAKFVYLSGYSLLNLPQREAVLEAGRIGRGNGSGVVFDPGSANLVKDHSDVFEGAIDSCDVLCANAAESKVLANGLSVSEYARSLSRKGKKVIVKAGPQGCLVSTEGELSTLPGVSANALDTTGAGDAFLGALLYCLSLDYDLTKSASFANWFASRKVEGLGPRHFPRREDADAFLKSIRLERGLEREETRV